MKIWSFFKNNITQFIVLGISSLGGQNVEQRELYKMICGYAEVRANTLELFHLSHLPCGGLYFQQLQRLDLKLSE